MRLTTIIKEDIRTTVCLTLCTSMILCQFIIMEVHRIKAAIYADLNNPPPLKNY